MSRMVFAVLAVIISLSSKAVQAQSLEVCRTGSGLQKFETLAWCLSQLSFFADNATRELISLRERVDMLESKVRNLSETGLTSGAVVAFDLVDGCPEGWVMHAQSAGRTIIGQGIGRGNTRGEASLTERRYRELGGEETHMLSAAELPAHSHGQVGALTGRSLPWLGASGSHPLPTTDAAPNSEFDWSVGEGVSYNIMQPYIVLYYCKKV